MKKTFSLLLTFAFALCGKAQNSILQFADWFVYNQPADYQYIENFSRNNGHSIRFDAHVTALPAGTDVRPKKTIEDNCVTDDVLQVVLRRFKACADGAEQVWSSTRPSPLCPPDKGEGNGEVGRVEETLAISGYKGDLRFDLTTNGGRITYMYRLRATHGAFLSPFQQEHDAFLSAGLNGYGGDVAIWGIEIPQTAASYTDFCAMLHENEEKFKLRLAEKFFIGSPL